MRKLFEYKKNLYCAKLNSPVGPLLLVASKDSLHAILWEKETENSLLLNLKKNDDLDILQDTKEQLLEYFDGKRKSFDLSYEAFGTDFQKRAWIALTKIPYGETISYSEQAKMIGNEKAAQAIGQANGRNPLPIIIPCHRVIKKSGELHGFSVGAHIKKSLLDLESLSTS